jgi:uncharacterized membrane protein YgcG
MGGRGSPLRYIRLGMLAVLLIGTLVFHLHGTASNALHIVYIVVIVAAIGTTIVISRRGGSGRSGPGRGGRFGGGNTGFGSGGGSFGSAPPPPAPSVLPENSDPEADG